MRKNLLAIALILFVAAAAATASTPSKPRPASEGKRECTCLVNTEGGVSYGVYDRENEVCDLSVECIISEE